VKSGDGEEERSSDHPSDLPADRACHRLCTRKEVADVEAFGWAFKHYDSMYMIFNVYCTHFKTIQQS
jgi:hypothetical protein